MNTEPITPELVEWQPDSTQMHAIRQSVGVYLSLENERGYITTEEQFERIAANATKALLQEPFDDRDVCWFKGISYDQLYPFVLEQAKKSFDEEVAKERQYMKDNPDLLANNARVLFDALLRAPRN